MGTRQNMGKGYFTYTRTRFIRIFTVTKISFGRLSTIKSLKIIKSPKKIQYIRIKSNYIMT